MEPIGPANLAQFIRRYNQFYQKPEHGPGSAPGSVQNRRPRRSNYRTRSKSIITGAGGLIFDIRTSRLLVVKGPIKWSLPKGHLEPGETPEEAGMREIFEETSLTVNFRSTNLSKKLRKCIYYYIILDNAAQLQLVPIDTNEISEVKWCTYSDLLKLDANKPLKYFINHWSQLVCTFYENRANITLTGEVPDPVQLNELRNKRQQDHAIYVKLYGESPKRHDDKDDGEGDGEIEGESSGEEGLKVKTKLMIGPGDLGSPIIDPLIN